MTVDRERLRDLGEYWTGAGAHGPLTTLATGVLELLDALAAAEANRDQWHSAANEASERAEATEASLAEARKAFIQIATPMPDIEGDWGSETWNWEDVAKKRRDIARMWLRTNVLGTALDEDTT